MSLERLGLTRSNSGDCCVMKHEGCSTDAGSERGRIVDIRTDDSGIVGQLFGIRRSKVI
jgi:hypothetical protein